MDPHDSVSPDAGASTQPKKPASGLAILPLPKLLRPFSDPLTKPESRFWFGLFQFSETQLEYVGLNIESAGGNYTAEEVMMVLRYKWPNEFQYLLEDELEELVQYKWRPDSRTLK